MEIIPIDIECIDNKRFLLCIICKTYSLERLFVPNSLSINMIYNNTYDIKVKYNSKNGYMEFLESKWINDESNLIKILDFKSAYFPVNNSKTVAFKIKSVVGFNFFNSKISLQVYVYGRDEMFDISILNSKWHKYFDYCEKTIDIHMFVEFLNTLNNKYVILNNIRSNSNEYIGEGIFTVIE